MARISTRDFNQNPSRAAHAAESETVIVTKRGKPAYVLLSHEAYQRLIGENGPSIVELLRQRDGELFDFVPPRLDNDLFRPESF